MSKSEFLSLVNMSVDLINSGFNNLMLIQALREYGLSYEDITPIVKQAYIQKIG